MVPKADVDTRQLPLIYIKWVLCSLKVLVLNLASYLHLFSWWALKAGNGDAQWNRKSLPVKSLVWWSRNKANSWLWWVGKGTRRSRKKGLSNEIMWFQLLAQRVKRGQIIQPLCSAKELVAYSMKKWKLLSHLRLLATPYSPWNSPGWNTGVGSHSLFQGIFPTQGSNPGLPQCRQILYQLSHQESPAYSINE